MKKKRAFRLAAFLAGIVIMLFAAGFAAAMEIELAEYHSPSADLVGEGEMRPGETETGHAEAEAAAPEARPAPEQKDYSDLWIGEWILQNEPESTLSIMRGSDGELRMEAAFYRMYFIEADLKAADDRIILFNNDGIKGSLTRGEDGSVILAAAAAASAYADDLFQEFFLNNLFIFTRDGKPARTAENGEDKWAGQALMTQGETADSYLPGEKFNGGDYFEFEPDGRITSWQHQIRTDYGWKTIRRDTGYTHVTEYDPSFKVLRNTSYDSGIIRETEEYTYRPDGQTASMVRFVYTEDGISLRRQNYEYDASGRLTAVRYTDGSGHETAVRKVEYAADGSSRETVLNGSPENPEKREGNREERWYDSGGRLIRAVSYSDGYIFYETKHEYTLDSGGKAVREISDMEANHNDGRHERIRTETERTYDEEGGLVRETEVSGSNTTEKAWLKNSSGKKVYEYSKYVSAGDFPSVFTEETEYDTGPSGSQLCVREYEYWSRSGRRAKRIRFSVGEGDRGTRMGIDPLPPAAAGEPADILNMEYLMYSLRYTSREELCRLPYIRRAGDAMYDTAVPFWLYGRPGTVRFLYGGGTSNRMQGVWWVCRDSSVKAAELMAALQDEGVEWNNGGNPGPWNMLGIRTAEGYSSGCSVTLSDASYGENTLIWVAFTFSWDQPEDGLVMPWETGEYRPYDSGAGAAEPAGREPEAEPEQEPVSAQEPEPEENSGTAEEDGPDPVSEPEPETAPEPAAEPEHEPEPAVPEKAPAEAAEWTGCWITGGDDQGELIITADGSGALKMKVIFMRTLDIEADLKALDAGNCSFETAYGHFSGTLTRGDERTLRFAVTGGMSMEDDENEFYYLLKNRVFTFTPADYADLFYEAPAEETESDSDWQGDWTAWNGEASSAIRIIRGVNGDFIMQISFSNGYMIAGKLEREDSRTMNFVTDDFSAMLTLNRKHRIILLSEAGAMSEAGNAALDAAGYVIEYRGEEPVPETASAAPREPAGLPEEAATAEPRAEGPADRNAGLIPVAGHPDYMQVPVVRTDATSYIVGKDPTAYMPFRMTDGDETTAYQFSAKETKPGSAYLYFLFEDPVTMDELWMKNGFWKGKDQYTRNCRVKKMTIEFRYAGSDGYQDPVKESLKDDKKRTGWAMVNLGRRTKVTEVRIRIDEIYRGTKFKNDVCVSEMMFVKRTDNE